MRRRGGGGGGDWNWGALEAPPHLPLVISGVITPRQQEEPGTVAWQLAVALAHAPSPPPSAHAPSLPPPAHAHSPSPVTLDCPPTHTPALTHSHTHTLVAVHLQPLDGSEGLGTLGHDQVHLDPEDLAPLDTDSPAGDQGAGAGEGDLPSPPTATAMPLPAADPAAADPVPTGPGPRKAKPPRAVKPKIMVSREVAMAVAAGIMAPINSAGAGPGAGFVEGEGEGVPVLPTAVIAPHVPPRGRKPRAPAVQAEV